MSNTGSHPALIPQDFVSSGDYVTDITKYTEMLLRDHNTKHYYPRAFAYRMLGNYEAALQDYQYYMVARGSRMVNDSDLLFIATCHWLLGDLPRAVDALRAGIAAPYSDISGGARPPALLFYAAQRLGDPALHQEALTLMRKYLLGEYTEWPRAIVPYLLGNLTDEALEHASQERVPPAWSSRQQSQAHFYVAVRAIERKEEEAYRERITRSLRCESGIYVSEFYFALYEFNNFIS